MSDCMLKGKCLNCEGEADFKCEIFKQWFMSQQNESLKSHSRKIIEEPIYNKRF